MRLSDYLDLPREDYTTRREPPNVCYGCGREVDGPNFGVPCCGDRKCREICEAKS